MSAKVTGALPTKTALVRKFPGLTPDVLAAALIVQFGYAVLPTRTGFSYEPKERLCSLWENSTHFVYEVAGRSNGQEWDKQVAFINQHWPGLLRPNDVKAEGHRSFWRVVRVPLPPASPDQTPGGAA